jgi:hypothetical protein
MRRMGYVGRYGRFGATGPAGSTAPAGATAPQGSTGMTGATMSGPVTITAGATGATSSNMPMRRAPGTMARWQGHRGGMGGGWMRGPLLPFIAGAAAAYILIRLSR